MKTAPIARRMWAAFPNARMFSISTKRWSNYTEPVLVIPDNPASREALVERVARAIGYEQQSSSETASYTVLAKAALAAIRK